MELRGLPTQRSAARATTVLRHEHQAILRMLDVLEQAAEKLKEGHRVSADTLKGLLEFFTLFADRCHHSKEENILFPMLERKGLPRDGGPVSAMRSEHKECRALAARMREEAINCGWDPNAARRLARAARNYATLLREHISKENNVLFMMAERLLTDAEQKEMAIEFERIEDERMGAGTHERLHAQMDTLAADLAD